MKIQELKHYYVEFLNEEGYVSGIDDDIGGLYLEFEDDDIFDDTGFYIFIDEGDINLISLLFAFPWECKNEEELIKLYKAASDTNAETKMVKMAIFVGENTFEKDTICVNVSIEFLLNNKDDFKTNFNHWLNAMRNAIDTLQKKMKKKKK